MAIKRSAQRFQCVPETQRKSLEDIFHSGQIFGLCFVSCKYLYSYEEIKFASLAAPSWKRHEDHRVQLISLT